jgi:hypothetical protein
VRSIEYNGEQATFSPDGTCVASIYGKFMKIWKTNAGYNHHGASTHVHDTIDNVYISPDERLVILKSKKGADILDVTTDQSLFMFPVDNILSIMFSLDSAFVAFLTRNGTVKIWKAHTHHHESIAVVADSFHIALSPDGSQLASLSPSHMMLWDLKHARCLANLEFDRQLQVEAQISFSINATSVCILNNSGTQSWRISPNQNTDLTRNSIKISDGTTSRLFSACPSRASNSDAKKLPMIFVPTTEEWSNQDTSAPCQSYRCDTDDEWILDQDGRRVLWIPPDERPRKIWGGFKREKNIIVQTESGKVYFVNFSKS